MANSSEECQCFNLILSLGGWNVEDRQSSAFQWTTYYGTFWVNFKCEPFILHSTQQWFTVIGGHGSGPGSTGPGCTVFASGTRWNNNYYPKVCTWHIPSTYLVNLKKSVSLPYPPAGLPVYENHRTRPPAGPAVELENVLRTSTRTSRYK